MEGREMIEQTEAIAEPLGNPIGTVILKAQVSNNGFKLKASGTHWELLNVAAAIIDHISVDSQTTLEDTIGAMVEILMQEDVQ